MKHIIHTFSIIILTSSFIFSQSIKDVGAGVIDFLLRNPKTANKMNTTETIALDIIGDLFKTQSERKHNLEYASAGRNQIIIQTNDGREAQFVKNEYGKVYLLFGGIIYPISQEIIYEANYSSKSATNKEKKKQIPQHSY